MVMTLFVNHSIMIPSCQLPISTCFFCQPVAFPVYYDKNLETCVYCQQNGFVALNAEASFLPSSYMTVRFDNCAWFCLLAHLVAHSVCFKRIYQYLNLALVVTKQCSMIWSKKRKYKVGNCQESNTGPLAWAAWQLNYNHYPSQSSMYTVATRR